MTQEQKERYIELIAKVGSVDEIHELGSLIMIEQSQYAKKMLREYREYAWKNGSSVIDLEKFIKENGI